MAIAGILLINAGFALDFVCPINKDIWTPSFVLFSAGWFFLVFAFVYLVTEVLHLRKWTMPLVVLGENPLFTYVACGLLPLDHYAKLFFGDAWAPLLGPAHLFVLAFGQLAVLWLIVYWLHRKKLIVKI
jgi:predicted acyltransferase